MRTAVVEDDEVDLVRLLLEIALDRACFTVEGFGVRVRGLRVWGVGCRV